MKKITPILIYFFSILIFILSWDYINLPYDEQNKIIAEYYEKKINPVNDTFKFLLFIVFPSLIFLTSYFKLNNNTYSINPLNRDFFLINESKDIKFQNLNTAAAIIIFFLILDYLLFDFTWYHRELDFFHEGTHLVPPINYKHNQSFWLSTFYDYGFIANNLSTIIWGIIGIESIGSSRFINMSIPLLNKITLVFIAKEIANRVDLKKSFKLFFFIILALGIVNLCRYKYYGISFYSIRHLIFLIFFLISIIAFSTQKKNKFFLVGLFSAVGPFWWLDTGLYINLLIIVIIFYCLIINKPKFAISTLMGVAFSWMIIFIIFPLNELKEFYSQYHFLYSVFPYLLGMEYSKPFINIFDWYTRPYIFFPINIILLTYVNFDKKLNSNKDTKVILNFLFVCSVVLFQSALVRSSGKHVIYSFGSILFLFYFLSLYLSARFFSNIKFFENISEKIYNSKTLFFTTFLILIFIFIFRLDIDKFKNFQKIKENISGLIYLDDNKTLNKDYHSFVKFYQNLTYDDNCVQVFTDNVSLPYFLDKPTCTRYYISNNLVTDWTDLNFIQEFEKNKPKYILYSAPDKILVNKENMSTVISYVNKNYKFHVNFEGYIIYKIIE